MLLFSIVSISFVSFWLIVLCVCDVYSIMAGKGAKKRNSKDSTGSKEKKKGGKKKNGRATGGSAAKSSKIQGDIFSDGAMENAYLICHNVQVHFDRLRMRLSIFVPTIDYSMRFWFWRTMTFFFFNLWFVPFRMCWKRVVFHGLKRKRRKESESKLNYVQKVMTVK